jgi:hypothetical protein
MWTLAALMFSMTALTTALSAHAISASEGQQPGDKSVAERLTGTRGQQFAAYKAGS